MQNKAKHKDISSSMLIRTEKVLPECSVKRSSRAPKIAQDSPVFFLASVRQSFRKKYPRSWISYVRNPHMK